MKIFLVRYLGTRIGCGAVSLRLEVIEELHDLPEAIEIKQR